jgi:predicted nucleic acid-binding protein
MIDDERFKVSISVPLVFEYEDAIKRNKSKIRLSESDIEVVLDYICLVAEHRKIFYLWRPFLKDPKDDMILEIAVETESNFIITFNKKDFEGIDKFNLKVATPKEFLKIIGEKI